MQVLVQNNKPAQAKPVTKPLIPDGLERLKDGLILLVEDNDINQLVATEMLKSLGMRVSIANNGYEALEMISKESFKAVLMDVQMPGLDGYQVTERLRADTRFTYGQLPVIAMTANAMAEDREKAIKAGMNDYVSKPVNITDLALALLRWVDFEPDASVSERKVINNELETLAPFAAPSDVIDVSAALALLNGNKALYLRILVMTQKEHADTDRAIKAALDGNNLELAGRLAHTLKGLAGQIGAGALRDASKDLEMAIAEGRMADCEPLRAVVAQKLTEALTAMAAITPESLAVQVLPVKGNKE
jgi:CheY-like chemotaxis protein